MADVAEDAIGPTDDLLTLVQQEARVAIGFENDQELVDAREQAMNYIKGDMVKYIPSLPNRSKAVSTDINDAIETILPDLMEIFTGGDDVVAFVPQKAEDEESAKQETAYLNQVVFQDNPGFDIFYEAFKDALTLKTGVFGWAWKSDINECVEEFAGKNVVELMQSQQDGEISNLKHEQDGQPIGQDSTFSFTLSYTDDNSCEEYWAIPPDDFAVAIDTVRLKDATYCCWRTRPRVQDLIAEGYDAEVVRDLPQYTENNTTLQQARDTAGEHMTTGSSTDQTIGDMRQVEIRKHHIRRIGDDGKLVIWCIVTDAQSTVELTKDGEKSREIVSRIPYSAITPYKTPHRFYGRSLADELFDIQKIKTALLRMLLDSGYFAQNQRHEIDMSKANDFTISDYLRNEPGVPVRVKSGGALESLAPSALGFDAYKALEYVSTVGEMRTGVVRNAQGLNPDTLHDTATGAMALLSAAQKRVRMIARIFAETGVKDLYLGIHADLRENARATSIAKLLGKWVPTDPSKWAERNSMTVEVGLGAAGKDAEIAAINSIALDMEKIVETQGGAQGPIVTLENVYKLATDKAKKLGVKSPEEYFTDPNSPEGKQAQQAMANKPDPEMAKVQGEQQLQQSKQQGEMALGQLKVQSEEQIQTNKAQAQAAVNAQQQQLEHERLQAQQANEMALEQLKIQSNERLEIMKLASSERIAIEVARIKNEGIIAAAEAKADAGLAQAELARQDANETETTS